MRHSNIHDLLPSFRASVERLLSKMMASGHSPRLHETYRSPERSAELVTKGTSRSNGLSMHCYRIAADVICSRHAWDCEARWCDFYTVLGRHAAALGLTWGGDWDGDGVTREQREHDLPHVQALPIHLQRLVRISTLPDLEVMLAKHAQQYGAQRA